MKSNPVVAPARRPGLPASIALAAVLAAAIIVAATPASAAPERHPIPGDAVSVYNLAGTVTLEPTDGAQVVVEVARAGRDAAQLRVLTGGIGSRQTLRITYPKDRVVYRGRQWSGRTQVRVRNDGTFGGRGSWTGLAGRRVTVASSGTGLEAYADLRILVPRGRDVAVHLAVGEVSVTNVDAKLLVEVSSAPVRTNGTRGTLAVDVGSGAVTVEDAEGPLVVDTGSGSVVANQVKGESISIDTGSGSVSGSALRAITLNVDTGSGSVDLRDVGAEDIRVDTGSGGVDVDVATACRSLRVDTGSGGVRLTLPDGIGAMLSLDTGSGGLDVELPLTEVHRDHGELRAKLGDGRGRIVVDTGSGGIRVTRR